MAATVGQPVTLAGALGEELSRGRFKSGVDRSMHAVMEFQVLGAIGVGNHHPDAVWGLEYTSELFDNDAVGPHQRL